MLSFRHQANFFLAAIALGCLSAPAIPVTFMLSEGSTPTEDGYKHRGSGRRANHEFDHFAYRGTGRIHADTLSMAGHRGSGRIRQQLTSTDSLSYRGTGRIVPENAETSQPA